MSASGAVVSVVLISINIRLCSRRREGKPQLLICSCQQAFQFPGDQKLDTARRDFMRPARSGH